MRKQSSVAAAAGFFAVSAVLSIAMAGFTAVSAWPGARASAATSATSVTPVTRAPAGPADHGPDSGCNSPDSCDTIVTFTVPSGALWISVPDTAYLSSAAPGGTASGALGDVTVTDDRASLDAAWSSSVYSSDFTTGGRSDAETIPADDVGYWSGTAVDTTGVGYFTPGEYSQDDEASLNTTETAFSESGGVGDDSATWDPTVDVFVPDAAVAGRYIGTVTESVS